MTDYGHPLWFGSFLIPSAADPARTVALAVLSEQVGLGLVTFQDHPYQPGLLDTWTLLSHVAARTTSVRLAPNVACLPLRPPAVLARAVAGLDLLSGGRIEFGLGAGAYRDPIAAMGGQRLRAGEAVQALEEAIAVLRQLWATTDRGSARVDGRFHTFGAPCVAGFRRTRSASGSAPTSPACSSSPGGSRTGGSRRPATSARRPRRQQRRRQRRRDGGGPQPRGRTAPPERLRA